MPDTLPIPRLHPADVQLIAEAVAARLESRIATPPPPRTDENRLYPYAEIMRAIPHAWPSENALRDWIKARRKAGCKKGSCRIGWEPGAGKKPGAANLADVRRVYAAQSQDKRAAPSTIHRELAAAAAKGPRPSRHPQKS